jgi:putative ABC transport system permease protein
MIVLSKEEKRMVFKNAFLSIKKNIGKTLLLFVIMALIANLVMAGLSIKRATEKSMKQVRESMGASASLSYNMQKLMQNRTKGQAIDKVMKAMKTTTADKLKRLKYVTAYNYSLSVGANSSSIDPVKTTTDSSSSSSSSSSSGAMKAPDQSSSSSSSSSNQKIEQTDFSVNGNTTMKYLTAFTQKSYTLKSGRLLTSSDKNTNNAVISSALASDNDLNVGSKFKVYATTSSGKKIKVTLTVVGIYKISSTSQSMDNMSNRQNPYNTIYTSLETAQKLNNSKTTISSATYYLDDPEHVRAFEKLAKKTSINWNTYSLQTSDEAYEASVSSFMNMEKFATIFLWVVIIAGSVILALILILSLRSRFYEFGVLLSLGESKVKIASQQLVEILMVAVIAFALSLGTGKMVSNAISSMLTSTSTSAQTTTSNTQGAPGQGGGGAGRMMQNAMTTPKSAELDVSITPTTAAELAGVTFVICVVSVAVPSIYILRMSPREILTKKEG